MENPFPLTNLTLISSQRNATPKNPKQDRASAPSQNGSIHCLEELFQLAFPESFERRLRLVYSADSESNVFSVVIQKRLHTFRSVRGEQPLKLPSRALRFLLTNSQPNPNNFWCPPELF